MKTWHIPLFFIFRVSEALRMSPGNYQDHVATENSLTSEISVTTISLMKIEYDPGKNQNNIKRRKLSFDLVEQFEWETSLVWEDDRYDYGETRFCALGYIGIRIYNLVFTYRAEVVRVISLRKANKREVNRYAET